MDARTLARWQEQPGDALEYGDAYVLAALARQWSVEPVPEPAPEQEEPAD